MRKSLSIFTASIFLTANVSLLSTALPFVKAQEDKRGVRMSASRVAELNRSGKQYALVIGNDDYKYLEPLATAINDAKEINNTLKNHYGFETRLLLNATREAILEAVYYYRRELDQGDSLLIYYAGHGDYDKEVDKAYWLPVDARKNDNVRWISADDITTNVKGIHATHVLIISDSCYSGMLRGGFGAKPLPSERSRYLQKILAIKSRLLIASGGNEPVADGGGDGHSVFARALLNGLKKMEQDVFTSAELFDGFIRQSVAGNSAQTPKYFPIQNSGHDNGDFVFFRRPKGVGLQPPSDHEKETEVTLGEERSTKPSLEKERLLNSKKETFIPSILKPETYSFVVATLDSIGNIRDRNNKQSKRLAEDLGDGALLYLVEIPGGTFLMGTPGSETEDRKKERPQHSVTVRPFYMAQFEITQEQWNAVAKLPRIRRDINEPESFRFVAPKRPVENVSWEDANEFCERLSKKNGRTYRLPTEAEWEYACRANTKTEYHFGETITRDVANYGDSAGRTESVYKSKLANAFGLYDMHGNVWEWCMDFWHSDYENAPNNGSAWSGGDTAEAVIRGGGWNSDAVSCRSAFRRAALKNSRSDNLGFRVVVAF